ncbi:MAG: SCO family protein [Acidobacteriota bacterium]|nr:MAG: SCO family protein [Acidobacteriota bacterium]
MKKYFIALILLALSAGFACTKAEENKGTEKRYPMKGKVVSVDKENKRAKIHHEDIEGFMDAMTMDFPIKADWVWDELRPGVQVQAEMVVNSAAKDPYWLENIAIVATAVEGDENVEVNQNFAQVGNPAPDFKLTNQDGKAITMADFKGKALGITFIYARCPLAEFCIKMSTNFSDAALELGKPERQDLRDKVRLLSISFDPANDTPEKLRSYGLGYLGKDAKPDFTVWSLAVGSDAEVRKIADFYGLRYEIDPEDKTQFRHSLRTIVIGPDGKVAKVIPGSDWSPASLLKDLEAALAK